MNMPVNISSKPTYSDLLSIEHRHILTSLPDTSNQVLSIAGHFTVFSSGIPGFSSSSQTPR